MNVRPSLLLIENNHLLLMHYRYGDADVYALPGGNPDRGETLPQTLARELDEELGISVEVGPMVLGGEVLLDEVKNDVLHCVFHGQLVGGLPRLNPDETTALAVVWKPLNELARLNLYPNVGLFIQDWQMGGEPLGYIGKIPQVYFA